MDTQILKGSVGRVHIEYAPKTSISSIMKQLKGRNSRLLQKEFPHLEKYYWGRRCWVKGFGVWSTGNVTEKMVQDDIEHHRDASSLEDDTFILEG